MTEEKDDQKRKGDQKRKDGQRKKDNQKKKDEEELEVNFGLGALSFGGLFQGIGNVIDQISRLKEESDETNGEANGEREFSSPSGRVKAIYGFSVKTSLGGKTLVEPFGNMKRTSKGPVVEEERQPVADVFNEQDHILIIAELPGIDEEHISTTIDGDILTLSAANGDRKYYKEVVLPEDAAVDTLTSKYKNGVLELRMSKK